MLDSDNSPVGYGRPPKESQFRPGQSGNLKGRPRGTKNTTKRIAELLDEPITVKEGGKAHTVSKRDAVLMRLINNALGGEFRALAQVLKMAGEFKEPEPLEIDDGDRKAFNTWMQSFVRSLDPEYEETNDEQ